MAITDDERLHQDLGLAIFHTAGRFTNERDRMAAVIDELRTMGYTITARPAPEPTYTIRLTERQRERAMAGIYYLNWDTDTGWGDDDARGAYKALLQSGPDK